MMMAPTSCISENGSPKISMPTRMDATVEAPIKDEVRFTPILAIAALDIKNARMEQPIP